MHKTFPLSKIKPNPFRDMESYPIRREKIDALRASIRKTSFWDNIVARIVDGHAEIAYGHHRLIALQEEKHKEAALIIRKLSDADMLRIMADENMQEWGSSAEIDNETVRAVVLAYAAGKLDSELKPPGDTNPRHLRYAPGFQKGGSVKGGLERPYNAETISVFLGWEAWKVSTALERLATMEETPEVKEDFRELGPDAATRLAREVRKAPPKQRKRVAKTVGRKIRSGQTRVKDIPQEAARARTKKPSIPPMLDAGAERLAGDLGKVLTEGDNRLTRLNEIIRYRSHLDVDAKKELATALKCLGNRCTTLRKKLTE